MNGQKPADNTTRAAERSGNNRTVLASLGAMISVLAASSCCLPLLPFMAAAGFAGSSALFLEARPYLLVLSILLIGYAFYQARRTKKCHRRPSRAATVLLCISAVFVAVSIFFPQVMANAVADLFSR